MLKNKNIHDCVNNSQEVMYCVQNKAIEISGHRAINNVEKLRIRIEK